MPIMTLKVLPYRLTVLIIWSGYLHFHFLSQILRGFISGLDCSQPCHYIGWNSFVCINFLPLGDFAGSASILARSLQFFKCWVILAFSNWPRQNLQIPA